MSLDAGTHINGRYEIQSLLGAGGMGEVYRARDTELNRPVALKFLHTDVAADQQRMQRFVQEARAASALNHPNILTVFDIGQTAEGARFFATEFVEGVTLRERMQRGRLKLGEVLDITIQIASALVAAHQAGIVHRDIKPENIMVRADGYVKVLDFGLAKLTGARGGAVDMEAQTQALVNTNPGAIMGTVAYMSPEQARGAAVDARTDIWSLGVVLYELLTGRVPFAGKSSSHVIVAILDDDPPPLTQFMPDAPEALQEVLADALAKDPEARYQTAKQMLAKLQRLKQRLDAGVHLDHSVTPEWYAANAASQGGAATLSAAQRTTARSGELSDAPTHASAAGLAPARRVSKTTVVVALALGLVALCGLGYGLYRYAEQRRGAGGAPFAALQNMKVAKLPVTGQTVAAALSPDGKYVARVVYERDTQSLRLRQVSTAAEKELIPPREDAYLGLTFSRDGDFIYYVSSERGQLYRNLYRISPVGGEPVKLAADVDSTVALAPDGRRIVFRRHVPKASADVLVVANEDGSEERTLLARPAPTLLLAPAWSPDGQTIAYVVKGTDEQGYYSNIEGYKLATGQTEVISSARWRVTSSLVWLADGSGLVMSGRDRASLPSMPEQVWFVPYPAGAPRRITNDVNRYVSVSLSADSKMLLALQASYNVNLWLAPGGDAARARTLAANAEVPAWTPDGRIVYMSNASGNGDIWVMNADGTGARQLTFDPNNDSLPDVAPDGRSIVFITNRSVGWSIWLMNADGSNQRELVRNVSQDAHPHFAPDSQSVYYSSFSAGGANFFWRVPAAGGQPVLVNDRKLNVARLAPDGRRFLAEYVDTAGDASATPKLFVRAVAGDDAGRTFDVPPGAGAARWSPDGQAIDYLLTRAGVSNLWRLPLNGGPPRQLTNWPADFITWFAWSPDGKQLAAARGSEATDLILIRDFR
ncbi:MAG TPA: protein kinase [Pyrinomonadaceae bacterium]|jgi:Tol biopolymer transport system component/tRNA A-37 threonylcarbamoyl transferase component Bud32